jgi:hypothetical protein
MMTMLVHLEVVVVLQKVRWRLKLVLLVGTARWHVVVVWLGWRTPRCAGEEGS